MTVDDRVALATITAMVHTILQRLNVSREEVGANMRAAFDLWGVTTAENVAPDHEHVAEEPSVGQAIEGKGEVTD